MIKRINAEEAPPAVGPYCHATIVQGILYSSGQIPINPQTGDVILGEIRVQTDQVMKNIAAVLKEAGIGWDRVLKMTIYLTDMDNFSAFNEIYTYHIGNNKPARSTVEVSRLPKDVLVEIDCIALIPEE